MVEGQTPCSILQSAYQGEPNETLAEADERANRIFQQMVKLLTEQEGITEQLKATNPIAWVQKMNNIHNCAMELPLRR